MQRVEERGEHGQDQRADDRAGEVAAPAEDRGPADDGGGDRRQHLGLGEGQLAVFVSPETSRPAMPARTAETT